MATETAATRTNTRRVKDHIINRFLKLADKVEADGLKALSDVELARYESLTDIFAKTVLPRSMEVSGEDGEAIKVSFDPVFNASTTPKTEGDSTEPSSV